MPLIHGFCFAIKSELLNTVGYFDENSFPRGYGEENDYCFRAADAGYSMVVATNTYIYHSKSKSYKNKDRIRYRNAGATRLAELRGRERITRAILTVNANPDLKRIRAKAMKLYEK